ncbi:hypothetical protein L6452_08051 [Arctium lappa]|uniref:Uncharacterized protein n=1 Tax=Arctium lappa TaxID=4217 RepID=A0ACB9DGP2_ARCLA|nr:hypothetical protein L6452_08051 [Arctium lappa]
MWRPAHVAAGTCKLRYKEILNILVDVARVHLPWGNDVSVKNIMKNAPIVIQYMEMKSMCNPAKQIKTLEEVGMDLDGLVVDCLNKGDENRSIEDYTDFTYNRSQDSTNWANEDLERLNVSPECLSTIYLKYLDEYSNVKTSIERIDNKKRERTSKSDFYVDTTDFWCGDSELSKKLFLDKILEKDVGLNAMPPSFVNGCLKTKRRKEKIEAAKMRIEKIMRPSMAANESGGLCVRLPFCYSKRKRRDTDWEDFVIETLLLHQVKEEEIE